jgi:hypothetical protein
MLWALEGKGSARKLRLYAVACVRRVLGQLSSKRHQTAVEVAERYADGLADASELAVACEQARNARRGSSPVNNARRAAVSASSPGDDFEVACWTRHFAALAAGGKDGAESAAELRVQARLLRCIFGNPFRQASLSASWRNGDAVALAGQAYASRDFSRLPTLADLLEGAGCTDVDMLEHCRSGGEHARGCWVVDFVRCVDRSGR